MGLHEGLEQKGLVVRKPTCSIWNTDLRGRSLDYCSEHAKKQFSHVPTSLAGLTLDEFHRNRVMYKPLSACTQISQSGRLIKAKATLGFDKSSNNVTVPK